VTAGHAGSSKRRRAFGSSHLRNGASVFVVRQMLDRATLEATLRYAATATDDLVNGRRDHDPGATVLVRSGRSPRGQPRHALRPSAGPTAAGRPARVVAWRRRSV